MGLIEGAQQVVNDQTLIPIGIALAVLLPITGWLIWLNGRLAKIDTRLESIEGLHSETWSFADMEVWAERLARRNHDSLDVPPIEQLSRRGRGRDDT